MPRLPSSAQWRHGRARSRASPLSSAAQITKSRPCKASKSSFNNTFRRRSPVRTNPFYDAWLFLIGRTGDHENSGVGWLLTLLFLALLAGSIWIARKNWQQDTAQRTREHLATWFMRVMIGGMWYPGS